MINIEQISVMARLAKISLTEKEKNLFQKDIQSVFDWMDQMDEEICPSNLSFNPLSVFREDNVTEGGCTQEVLSNAPRTEEGFFVVPKIIES